MEILIIICVILFLLILGWMLRGSSGTSPSWGFDIFVDILEALCSIVGSIISSDDSESDS